MCVARNTGEKDYRSKGFTLSELLIVVLILGILAALVVPKFTRAAERTRVTTAATNMKLIADAARRYHLKHGEWPTDVVRGVWPPDFEAYLVDFNLATTAVGGKWDWDNWQRAPRDGVTIAVSLLEIDDTTMAKIDAELDDGILDSGYVRKNGDRLQLVLETE